MGKVIAVAGKGGTGKTTTSALMVKYFSGSSYGPILAVDADPNSNLGETLGVEITSSVGDIRENFMKDPQGVPSGMDKVNYLEMLMNQAIIEEQAFDLLVMGRQEGTGCYCMVNNILNRFTEELAKSYKYLLVDNEAGMEHLSRRTSGRIDMLFLITDYSLRGLRAVRRIHGMLDDLKLDVKRMGIVVTRTSAGITEPSQLNKTFLEEVNEIGVDIVGMIPDDSLLVDFDMERRAMMELPEDAPSLTAVSEMMERVMPIE